MNQKQFKMYKDKSRVNTFLKKLLVAYGLEELYAEIFLTIRHYKYNGGISTDKLEELGRKLRDTKYFCAECGSIISNKCEKHKKSHVMVYSSDKPISRDEATNVLKTLENHSFKIEEWEIKKNDKGGETLLIEYLSPVDGKSHILPNKAD